MRKLYRIAAYFILFTFVLSLSDWPFMDEILAEQAQLQQESLSSIQTDDTATITAKAAGTSHAAGSLYQSLANFIDMPRHVIPSVVEYCVANYRPESSRFISAMLAPFERPPIFSLS